MAGPSVTLFGPLDTLVGPWMEYVVLVLVVSNLLTRKLATDAHRRQAAEGGAEAVSRHTLHAATSWALVVASLYYMTLHHHAGMVLTVLALGVFVADFFEFESRKVEAREDRDLESPKGAIVASVLLLLYAAYIALFFLVEGYWATVF